MTVSLLNPKNRLKVHGGLDTLMLFSTARPFPSGIPLFLLPDSPFGLDTNSFDLHARQSYLGALFSGPELGEFQSGAQILAFLQNDNLTQDDYGLLVYYAYGELKNEHWRFSAGLQQDVFNPVSPTVVYLTKMYASGNTGSYRGQLRLERFWQEGSDFGVTLQAALSEPLSTLVAGDVGRITEDNGWPNVESRIELGFGPRCDIRGASARPLEIGISGVVGQFRTTRTIFANPPNLPPRAVIDTWGIGSDIELWATDAFGVRGEAYYGQGLGEYNGGILQSFNPDTFQDIRTGGGFGEVFYYFTDAFHVHVGYGIDAPNQNDLAATQIRRNQTYFVNWVWDLSKAVQLGLEVDYRKTNYTEFQPNVFLDNDAVTIATRFLWRF
ncbi:MAG: hypothetical protein CMJ58_22970 [Planctomycetaceae bacterium]|nr:hypothetical protein [Planctomycetaceae bacterium]